MSNHDVTKLAGESLPAVDADRLIADLRLLVEVADATPLVCGPFLGEIGYETLYWIPFLARMLEVGALRRRKLVIMSRGGTEALYRCVPECRDAQYVDVIDVLGDERFLELERRRLVEPRAKNQKASSAVESAILAEAGLAQAVQLLPAHMFRLLRRYPVETLLSFPWRAPDAERENLTVVKFWFGGQFPATNENLEFIRRLLDELVSAGPVTALDNDFTLELNPEVDEPFRAICRDAGVTVATTTSYRTNLAEQIGVLFRAKRLVSTYGGFCYLGLYTGIEIESYYTNPRIVFTSHLQTFAHALACLNAKTDAGPAIPFSLIQA